MPALASNLLVQITNKLQKCNLPNCNALEIKFNHSVIPESYVVLAFKSLSSDTHRFYRTNDGLLFVKLNILGEIKLGT